MEPGPFPSWSHSVALTRLQLPCRRELLKRVAALDVPPPVPPGSHNRSMRRLPEGTITLVFTDIEGSTHLLKTLGADYGPVLAQHRSIIRKVFSRRGGVEVDTQGDAFFYAFPRASEAVAAAADVQEELQRAGPVRVRIGIHTGEPTRTEEGYAGLAVNVAARISSAGHGGQVLVSPATHDLVHPANARDLGDHDLKDVGITRIYQVGLGDFPTLRSRAHQTNLPTALNLLVGRAREVDDIIDLIRGGARLVTIHGPAGVGKTRVAQQVGQDLASEFLDGVWFVDLAAANEPEMVEQAILGTLGASGPLASFLRDRRALLILDNLEQLIAWAPKVGELVSSCPGCVFITTSRELLRIQAEHRYPLDALTDDAAVELFRHRAQSVRPDFASDKESIRRLCRKLDNLPLAVELAAARIRIYSVDELMNRLESRLTLLTGGARDRPARHQTLRGAIEWSYELLTPDEQRLFAALSVFVSGFTMEAAEEVTRRDANGIESLVDKSLVQVVVVSAADLPGAGSQTRFHLLESVREYASEMLAGSSGLGEVRDHHGEYFARFVDRTAPELTGSAQQTSFRRVSLEYDNLRAALEWSRSQPRLNGAFAQLTLGLTMYWFNRATYLEGLHWLETVLDRFTQEGKSRGEAAWGAGVMHVFGGNANRGRELLQDGLAEAEKSRDLSLQGRCLDLLALLTFFGNDIDRARQLYETAISCFRRTVEPFWLADCLATLGSILPLSGEFERAEELAVEALSIARGNQERQGIRMALFALALMAVRTGRFDEARSWGDEGLAICRELGDRWFISYMLWLLALTACEMGDLDEARQQAAESLRVAREVGAPLLLVCALEASGRAARLAGDIHSATMFLTEAAQLGESGIVPGSYVAAVQRELGLTHGAGTEEGRNWLERSLTSFREAGDPWSEAKTLACLAQA